MTIYAIRRDTVQGRSYEASASSASVYRCGFNGKEKDLDAGEWIQDYGMRIYDCRLARFFSEDPITDKYPELTPYQFASNKPIDGIDLDGLEYYPSARNFTLEGFRQIFHAWATRIDDVMPYHSYKEEVSKGNGLVFGYQKTTGFKSDLAQFFSQPISAVKQSQDNTVVVRPVLKVETKETFYTMQQADKKAGVVKVTTSTKTDNNGIKTNSVKIVAPIKKIKLTLERTTSSNNTNTNSVQISLSNPSNTGEVGAKISLNKDKSRTSVSAEVNYKKTTKSGTTTTTTSVGIKL